MCSNSELNVTIRPLVVEDAFTSVKWRNDPEIFKYTGNTYDHIITIQEELTWINKVISNKNDYRCAIEVKGRYVGNIYITNIHDGIGEFHIFIGDRNYWGKGIAKCASMKMLAYAFSELLLTQINLSVRPQNERALHLYQQIGFKEIDRNSEFIKMEITNI